MVRDVSSLVYVLVAVKSVILLLGGLVTYMTYRAYRRTSFEPLGWLSLGLALVTLGALAGGVAHQLLDLDLVVGVVVESTLIVAGFLVIAYSLYSE